MRPSRVVPFPEVLRSLPRRARYAAAACAARRPRPQDPSCRHTVSVAQRPARNNILNYIFHDSECTLLESDRKSREVIGANCKVPRDNTPKHCSSAAAKPVDSTPTTPHMGGWPRGSAVASLRRFNAASTKPPCSPAEAGALIDRPRHESRPTLAHCVMRSTWQSKRLRRTLRAYLRSARSESSRASLRSRRFRASCCGSLPCRRSHPCRSRSSVGRRVPG